MEDSSLSTRLAAAAKRYNLTAEENRRLEQAMSQWLSSRTFARACGFAKLLPEHAFCAKIAGEVLEGFIDLLCIDPGEDSALVIDYKTGVSGTVEELRERYRLQASVYAAAVLRSGLANAVELVFVRPEAGLQEVVYNYSLQDVAMLEQLICSEAASFQKEDD